MILIRKKKSKFYLIFRVKNFEYIFKRDKKDTIPGKMSLLADKFIEKNEKKKLKKFEEIRKNEKNIIKEDELLEDSEMSITSNLQTGNKMEKFVNKFDSEETLKDMDFISDADKDKDKRSKFNADEFENVMHKHAEMDQNELEYERLDVRKHFVGNVKDRLDKFKSIIY